VQDYRYVISQYAQTSLRDVIGQMTLDQLLTEREEIAKSIEHLIGRTKEPCVSGSESGCLPQSLWA